jgi:hypothetical protein
VFRGRFPAGMLVLAALLTFSAWPSLANGSVSKFQVDVSGRYSSCAEIIDLTGTASIIIAFTRDANGGTHEVVHLNWQGVSGVGELTGVKYQAIDSTQTITTDVAAVDHTSIANIRFVGQGQVPDLLLGSRFHLTVNPDGDVVVSRTELTSVCK